MKSFNFVVGLVFAFCLAILGYMNKNDPNAGWILGVLLINIAFAVGVGIGLFRSALFEENGALVAAGIVTVALCVVLAPAFFFHGWMGVFFSAMLLIFWERLCVTK